jgi:hypothetical protein
MIEPYPIEYRFAKCKKREKGALFDIYSDEPFMVIQGGHNSVPMDRKGRKKLVKNNIFTHSHPYGSKLDKADCFSMGDIGWACYTKPAAMRVVIGESRKIYQVTHATWGKTKWHKEFSKWADRIIEDITGFAYDSDYGWTCRGWPNCLYCNYDQYFACKSLHDIDYVELCYRLADVCDMKLEECSF